MRFAPRLLAGRGGGDPEGRRRLRPRRSRPRRAHQRRVRVGQPDRAHARRPLPRRGVRRRAGNLLAFAGYDVTREYYINDAGAQVDALARSAYLRYREALGEDIGEIPAGLYPGDYVKPVGEALAQEYDHTLLNFPEERWLPLVREAAIAAMLAMIKEDLAALNVEPRGVLLGAVADGAARRDQDHHRGAAQEGPRLRGPAGEAQGPRRRRVGGPRADAVQVDRLRRRRRPRADEVGRQLHLFRRRHGLPPQQARAAASGT